MGSFLGLAIGAFATMFTAGYAAGFFAGPSCSNRNYGIAYGFVSWCLGLLLMGLFMENHNLMIANKYSISSPARNEVTRTTENVTTKLHPATDESDTRAEKDVRALGLISISMFFIFFIGALAACFGGYFGFYCWDEWEKKYRYTRVNNV